ncbi:MAG: hypothetical protein AAGP08_03920 [Pseudomonadota bacterium]
MSDRGASNPGSRLKGEHVLIGGVLILVVLAVLYVMSQRQQVLRNSPAGLDGLQIWLSSEGLSAQAFTGGWSIDQSGVGLLVVPLYDTDLDNLRPWPQTQEELLLQQDEYDVGMPALFEKRRRATTLVVLPKWRSGMRLTGIGHPVLLSDVRRIDALARRLSGDASMRVVWSEVPFLDFESPDNTGTATIYAAQMLQSSNCTPVIGTAEAMLLARCPIRSASGGPADMYVLSDPDLLNNHGLRLGDNARIVSALFADLAGEKNIIIDYSPTNWLFSSQRAVARDRTWNDLAQFFAPPFTLLWVAGVLALALVLWRAAIRFGPVLDTKTALTASKLQAIAARARLMRLSNQDGAMLEDYAKVRIATLGAQLFGPSHARHYASEENFLRYVKRRHPEQAGPLAEALNTLRSVPKRISASHALAEVDALERVLEQIANDT